MKKFILAALAVVGVSAPSLALAQNAPTLAAGVTSPIVIAFNQGAFENADGTPNSAFSFSGTGWEWDGGNGEFAFLLSQLFTDTDAGDTLTFTLDNSGLANAGGNCALDDFARLAPPIRITSCPSSPARAAPRSGCGNSRPDINTGAGVAEAVLTASDGTDSVDLVIRFDIESGGNQPPVLTAAVTPAFIDNLAQTLAEDFDPPVVLLDDISTAFSDPEGDAITFTFSGPVTAVVTPSVRSNADGTQDIILTAIADVNNDNLIEELVITPRDAGTAVYV